jgi:hypothetical protein
MSIKKSNSSQWRKGIILSATFLTLLLVVGTTVSCNKKQKPVGESALSNDDILNSGGVDTFALKTFSIIEDSVSSKDPRFNLLGAINDPVFGTTEASFYTQISLSGFSPDFGVLADVIIDSFIVSFRYGGYYGEISEHLFEVYAIDEDLHEDSSYYEFSTVLTQPTNLVPVANNEGYILPKPLVPAVVGQDTVSPQLRIPLDTLFARQLMQLAETAADNEEFIDNFKGLFFKVNNGAISPGSGNILYLESTNPASKLTVYYKKNNQPEEFDFLISSSLVDFNHVDIDNSSTNVDVVLNDTLSGQTEFYAQAFKTRAKIQFPSFDDLPKDIVIHKATLELPVNYFLGDGLYPSTIVSAAARFQAENDQYFLLDNNVQYNQQKRAYIINLRPYLQSVINGQAINDGIIVSPLFFNTSTERMIFNGPNTTNKLKPKLSVVYTEF